MKTQFAVAILMLALAAPTTAPAATPAPGTPASLRAYHVEGFRSAKFGESEDQVTAAIEKDLGAKPADIRHMSVPADGTNVLVVTTPQMIPAPGPATVTYIFGKNGQLIHVNVVWLIANAVTAEQRQEMLNAGLKLSGYFRAFSWDAKRSALNIPTGPNSVTMFLGRDQKGGAVEVSAAGIAFERTVNGKSVPSPAPTGPVRLKIGYGSASEGQDITTIKQGQF